MTLNDLDSLRWLHDTGTSIATLALLCGACEARVRAAMGISQAPDQGRDKVVARKRRKSVRVLPRRATPPAKHGRGDAEAQIAEWLRRNKVTRCPTRYARGAYESVETLNL